MKTILCYGDSNTWGYAPGSGDRYSWNLRWPGVLQCSLGPEYRIIEEGLNGRTTCWDDPLSSGRNGHDYLTIALETHSPLNLVILMLGTNDLKARYNLSSFSIAQGAAKLVELAKRFEPTVPNILLLSPPHIVPTEDMENTLSFEGAIEKSKGLAIHYRYFAQQLGCHFIDASLFAESSPVDGIHLEVGAQKRLAEGLETEVRKIFKERV